MKMSAIDNPVTRQAQAGQWLSNPAVDSQTTHRDAPSTNWANATAGVPARYEILSEVGMGGTGIVYKVRDLETGEIVALKVLKPGIASDQEMQQSLRKEVCLARKVTHKNVCRIHEFNRSNSTACLSMEFVEGETLLSKLRRSGPLPVSESIQIAKQICAGLREAHAQGIVHRDLKPANIMLDRMGVVKVMDFGIARLSQGNGEMTGTITGTPAYMAPEQVQLKPMGPGVDIYAVGLLLYEMITGKPAFDGDDPIAIAVKQIQESPRGPGEIVPGLPAHTEAVVLKCLRKDPAKRFQSVDELCAAFEENSKAKAESRRTVSLEFRVPDLKEVHQAVGYGVEKARAAAAPRLATLAAELQRARLAATRLASTAIQEARAFVRTRDLRAAQITRNGWALAVLGIVLVGTVFAYGHHAQAKNHAGGGPQPAIDASLPKAASSADMGKLADQGRGLALSALSTGDADKSVTVNEVDLSGSSDAASANGSLPAAAPTEQVSRSQATSASAADGEKAQSPSKTLAAALIRTHSAQTKTRPRSPAITQTPQLSGAIDGKKTEEAKSDVAEMVLPFSSPDPTSKPADSANKEKAAVTSPEPTETYLEVGSFKDASWADKAVDQLSQLGFHAVAIHKNLLWMQSYHVQVGPYTNAAEMEAAEKQLTAQNFKPHPVK
jgi:cell division protein FtsN